MGFSYCLSVIFGKIKSIPTGFNEILFYIKNFKVENLSDRMSTNYHYDLHPILGTLEYGILFNILVVVATGIIDVVIKLIRLVSIIPYSSGGYILFSFLVTLIFFALRVVVASAFGILWTYLIERYPIWKTAMPVVMVIILISAAFTLLSSIKLVFVFGRSPINLIQDLINIVGLLFVNFGILTTLSTADIISDQYTDGNGVAYETNQYTDISNEDNGDNFDGSYQNNEYHEN